jgi:DNA invertase Pin-like site-specific DNA recombinase
MKRAVIYARYSSDLQKDRSIDDQIALCEQIAARNGCNVINVYSDRAKSGASMFERDNLLALMNAAKKCDFDVVIAESLSRLSRDQEDTAAIFKRLKFNNVTIIDTNGIVSDVHIGVGGIVNSMFLKNLAVSVKRSLGGRVREGLVPGRIAFGYRGTGKPCEREIDPENGKIVQRIFEEYADGKSMRDIADELARDGIATPGLINGDMLRNQIYIGKVVWNATSSVKNPDTGRRLYRRGAEQDKIIVDAPHLRIIPQDLWDRVETIRASRREAQGWYGPRERKVVNKDHLLLGLLTCSKCNGSMIVGQNNPDGSPRVVCSVAYRHKGCDHKRSYCLKTIQTTILTGIKDKLTDRNALLEMTRAYHGRWAERQKETRTEADVARKQLNRVTVQIDRIVTAISDSDAPVKALVDKLKTLEFERAGLVEKVRLIEAEGNVVTLHPAAIDRFSDAMEEMHTALTSDIDIKQLAPFRAAFRNTFERIVVHPTAKMKPVEVTPYTRISAIMGLELFPKMRSTAEMLAEQGVAANGENKILPGSPTRNGQDRNCDGLISLGCWRQAA